MRVESLRSKGSLLVSPSVPREPKESVCPQDTLGPRAPERPAGMSKYRAVCRPHIAPLLAGFFGSLCGMIRRGQSKRAKRPLMRVCGSQNLSREVFDSKHYTACCATVQNGLSTSPRTPLNQTPVWAAACFYGFCSERVTERSPPPSASAQPVRSSILPRRV